jgi:quinol monooxygenase YgiN
MIVVTAKMTIKSGFKDEFVACCQELIEATRKEKGCISYNLYSDTDNQNELVMLEFWEDIGSLNIHMETEHFKKFGGILDKFLVADIEVISYSAEQL